DDYCQRLDFPRFLFSMITVSNSELRCFLRCPKEHQYRYVHRKTAIKEAEALSVGTRIHHEKPTTPIERAMLRAWKRPNLVEKDVFFLLPLSDSVAVTGEFDGIVEDERGERFVHELKTTSKDISPGSYYWRHVAKVDPQATVYLLAAEKLGLG